MTNTSLRVLLRSFFPELDTAWRSASLSPLGNAGGFSGASLWRLSLGSREFCVRLWPSSIDGDRLGAIHRAMGRAGPMAVVPDVIRSSGGMSALPFEGRLLEVTTWLPGRADFYQSPSRERLRSAARALAEVHRLWQPRREVRSPSPAVGRRLALLDWSKNTVATRQPITHEPILVRSWNAIRGRLDETARTLHRWTYRPVVLQTVLADPWHDHLLFVGDRLTGLVDYGEVKVDSPALDLGRMLGSLVGDDLSSWQLAFDFYRQVRPLSDEEEDLSRCLDRTGTVLGVVNWLRWLYYEPRTFHDTSAALSRLEGLTSRVERWG